MKLEIISMIVNVVITICWILSAINLCKNLDDKSLWFCWIFVSIIFILNHIDNEFKELKERNDINFKHIIKRLDNMEQNKK